MTQKTKREDRITITDVAKRAGVVPSTVSHVLNKTASISEETKERVMQAIEELNYIPNASARALRHKRTGIIGVALQDISSEFYAKCTASMLQEARKDNYVLMVMDAVFDVNNLRAEIGALIEHRVEGLVFIGGGDDEDILQEATKANIPIVLGDRNSKAFSSVDFNNEETVHQLIHMLYDAGYRRFGYAGEPLEVQMNLKKRFDGFSKGLDECGVPETDRVVLLDESLHKIKLKNSVEFFTDHFVDQEGNPTVDVILTSNDLIAQGFIAAANRLHIDVPGRLGIVGFDDISICSYLQPALTTIAQNERELGKQCYRLVKNMIDGNKTEEHIVIPQVVKSRNSTKIPREIIEKYQPE